MKNFKDNQKVTHPKYGEGIIRIDLLKVDYIVHFNEIKRDWSKIGDDFYNQLEAVEDLPEIGEYAYFWDFDFNHTAYAKYLGKSKDTSTPYLAQIKLHKTPFQFISKTPPKFD